MGLDKETLIGMMQDLASDMAIEYKSLEWLMKNKESLSKSIANCERSAQKLREFIINECDGRDISCEAAKELKNELVEAIEIEAELEKVIVKQLDEEINKRLGK